ncbi:MAG: MOSC domain-containing protein [Chloroflexota bacterium]|jgi:MOSC domain-containing protein YiiM
MSGRINNLFIKPAHGEPMRAVDAVQAESGQGLVGDASYGRSKRQVLIINSETLQRFALEPGQVRENLTIEGLPLAALPTGTTLRAGDVLLEITVDCAPCHFLDDIRHGLQEAMEGQRGKLCRVSGGGKIRLGDEVRIVSPD